MITTFRQSHLDTWEKCAEIYRRRYIENEIIPPGLAAHIGSGVHRGAEVNHKAKIKTGQDEPLDVIQDAARDSYVEAVKTKGAYFAPEDMPSARAQANAGVDEVVSLARLYHGQIAPEIKPALVEKKVVLRVTGLEIPISGTVDLVTESGALIDFKTASKAWPASRAEHSPQATIYHKLVEAETGQAPEEIRFEVLIKGAKPRRQTLPVKRTEADFQALVPRLALMYRMIQAGIFPPAQTGSWQCSPKYCGYWASCPYFPAHKKVLPNKSIGGLAA
jgi:hypothetical protein